MLKKVSVMTILREILTDVDEYSQFNITLRDDNENIIFSATGSDVVEEFCDKYSDWYFVCGERIERIYNDDGTWSYFNPVQSFLGAWTEYMAFNDINFAKMWQAYIKEYNPIENYNKLETHTGGKTWVEGGTDFETNTASTTDTPGVTTTVTDTPDNFTTTTSGTTYTSGNFNNIQKQVQSGSTSNVTSHEGFDTVASSGRTDRGYNKTGSETYNNDVTNVSGNIGVTTSQQMIQSELDLRKLNLLDYIVKGFAHEYLIVAGGEDGGYCGCYN